MGHPTRLGTLADRLDERFAEATSGIALSWPPVAVTVGSAVRPVLEHAAHRYRDHFDITAVASAQPDLICVIDAGLAVELADRRRAVEELDGGTAGRPAYRLMAAAGPDGPLVALRAGERRMVISVVDSADFRSAVVRQIRAIAAARLHALGWVPVHAAGVTDQAKGALVIFGPRMAGKTTTLLSLLSAGAGALLANDTVFLRWGAVTEARAFPVSVGIRPDTMRLFSQLRPGYGRSRQAWPDPAFPAGTGDRTRLHLPPDEVAAAFGVPVDRGGIVRAFVRVRFERAAKSPRLRRVGRHEFAQQLAAVRLDADPAWSSTWLNRTGVAADLVVPAAFADTDVPAYELITGPDMRGQTVNTLGGLQ